VFQMPQQISHAKKVMSISIAGLLNYLLLVLIAIP
jgi:hypothetical protein